MSRKSFVLGLMTTVAASVLAAGALADPPARVGRIAYIDGGLSFQAPGQDDWTDASRNYPVTSGEAFWTGDDGRAELQIGSVEARLDNQTELDTLDVQYGDLRVALPQGSLELRLWSAPEGGVTVSTPAGDVQLDQQGLYRIDVGAPPDDGSYPPVEVTVFEGQAGAPSPEGLTPVDAGQAALIYAGYDPQSQDAQDTAIDDWGSDREAQERWRARPDIPVALTGFEDLDGAGDFVSDPDYGEVWFPRDVPPDWAPYRYGRWAYVAPWGYTWVDDAPWGFAPFHYGRWAQIDGRWGWIPGRLDTQPVYAPALVAFVGGDGWSVGFAGGEASVGWVPLGPDEIYQPTYEVSEAYDRRVNAGSVRPETLAGLAVGQSNGPPAGRYRNLQAATVVRASALSGATPVQRAMAPVSASALAAAPRLGARGGALPAPTPAARAGAAISAAARAGGAPPVVARPPERLQAVRAAVVAAPANTGRPPAIAGARIAPPAARPPGASPARLIAPAQVRAPAAQGRRTVAIPPHGASPTAPSPAARAPAAARVATPADLQAQPRAAARPPAAQESPTRAAPVRAAPPAPAPVAHPQMREGPAAPARGAGQPPTAKAPTANPPAEKAKKPKPGTDDTTPRQ